MVIIKFHEQKDCPKMNKYSLNLRAAQLFFLTWGGL